jgi:anti-sigma factor RsiW
VTLPRDTMLKLMAYADGELEGAEQVEVEALLASDPDAARFVEDVAGLGDFVKVGHEDRDGAAIAAFDVADAVMAKAEAEAPRGRGKVVSLVDARERRRPPTRVIGAVVAVLALAASIFLLARPSETPMGASSGGPVAIATPTPQPADAVPPIQVTAVESAGHSVSVFYLPSANEVSTSVVIWVDETGDK